MTYTMHAKQGNTWVECTPYIKLGETWLSVGRDSDEFVPDPSLTERRQIAAYTSLQTGLLDSSTTGAGETYALDYAVAADAQGLVLSVDASRAGGQAVLVVNGTPHRATFGGSLSFARRDNIEPVFSDAIQVRVAKGDSVTCRIFLEAAPSGSRAVAKSFGVTSVLTGTGNVTGTGAGMISKVTTLGFVASLVGLTGLTRPSQVSVLGLGDSLFESGTGNPSGYSRGLKGAGLPFLNAGRWAGSTPPSEPGIAGLVASFTHCLDEYGFNDLSGEPVAKTKADKLVTWGWLKAQNPAMKITACTVTPSAESTDGWTTLTGQTPTVGQTHDGQARWERSRDYNRWIRDGAPVKNGAPAAVGDSSAARAGQAGHPLVGVLDVAANVEYQETGKFRIDRGVLPSDGVHMRAAGGTLIAEVVEPWARSLTV